ncbi:MAG: FAD-binding protein [Planktomarina sp.]|nr:FAD-binding protein [Planktomarina sp.]
MSTAMFPEDEAALSDAILDTAGPLQILGGGTRRVGRISEGRKLSTAQLKGIVLYEPGALTIVAKTGTPIAEIENVLAAENQMLAFEPMDHRVLLGTQGTPTLGGVMAANVSGPRRIQVGAARDFALGISFVDGSGQLLKNGGRVMKNVTGYDLVKLMVGSWGTLGVLSEVALKVLPVSETQATLKIHVSSWAQAVACMSAALGTPFDVSGAATLQDSDGKLGVIIRVEGFAASIRYRMAELKIYLTKFGDIEKISDPWSEVKNLPSWATLDTIWKVSVRPTDSLAVILKIQELQKDFGFKCQLDWGGGLLWLGLGEEQLGNFPACVQLHNALQETVAQLGGHATLMKSQILQEEQISHFQPLSRAIEMLTQTLRSKFDPRGILNLGRMS